jgi:hypothetical protein
MEEVIAVWQGINTNKALGLDSFSADEVFGYQGPSATNNVLLLDFKSFPNSSALPPDLCFAKTMTLAKVPKDAVTVGQTRAIAITS